MPWLRGQVGVSHDNSGIHPQRTYRRDGGTACDRREQRRVVSNSRGPETLADLVAELGPADIATIRAALAAPYVRPVG